MFSLADEKNPAPGGWHSGRGSGSASRRQAHQKRKSSKEPCEPKCNRWANRKELKTQEPAPASSRFRYIPLQFSRCRQRSRVVATHPTGSRVRPEASEPVSVYRDRPVQLIPTGSRVGPEASEPVSVYRDRPVQLIPMGPQREARCMRTRVRLPRPASPAQPRRAQGTLEARPAKPRLPLSAASGRSPHDGAIARGQESILPTSAPGSKVPGPYRAEADCLPRRQWKGSSAGLQ